jgi:septation ring formation regulator EzrA
MAAPFLGGCVVFDIRNELRRVNQRLDDVNESLVRVNEQLESVDASLSDVNETLATSDQSLKSINESMEPIRISLRRIDDHLAGAREVIDAIAKVVPGLKPDTPPPAKQEPTRETTPQKK